MSPRTTRAVDLYCAVANLTESLESAFPDEVQPRTAKRDKKLASLRRTVASFTPQDYAHMGKHAPDTLTRIQALIAEGSPAMTAKTVPAGWSLLDGEERNRLNPETFEVPSRAEREAVPVGHYAKVGLTSAKDGERFWTIIRERQADGRYIGEINNNLAYRHGFVLGDRIAFGQEHILDILEPPSHLR